MLDGLVHDGRVNAAIGWALVGAIAAGGVRSVLAGSPLWGVLALVVAAVIVAPAVAVDPAAVVPWPLVAVAALGVVAGAAGRHVETAGYVVVAALALVVAVELDAFTRVELGRRFAVVFAVLTTMAVQAVWTVVQFFADRWLGTEFLRSQTELQMDIVTVTAVGVGLGVLFYWYVARFDPVGVDGGASNRRGAR